MACSLRSTARRVVVALSFLVLGAFCASAQSFADSQPLLPKRFAGWTAQTTPKSGSSPAELDAANADVLSEYGLKGFAEDTYDRNGVIANVRAMRFADATGAYGAFTFYRKPDMKPLTVGKGGAEDAHELAYWTGNTLVEITSEDAHAVAPYLKALAQAIPASVGRGGVPPTLPDYLPARLLDTMTVRYAIGPAAYAKGGGVLPPDAIAFDRDAEAVTAQYSTNRGPGTLTLLEFPTPQMAIGAEKVLNALLKGPLPASLKAGNSAALGVSRSGPLVAVTSGNFSGDEAHALLAQVKYEANVTWNRGDGSVSEVHKAAEMLIGIAYLTAILALCAFVVGFFLGGGRALWRVMHGRPISSLYETDFISLNLSDWQRPARKMP